MFLSFLYNYYGSKNPCIIYLQFWNNVNIRSIKRGKKTKTKQNFIHLTLGFKLGKSKTRLYDSSLLKKQTVWKCFLHTNVGTFSADSNKSARKYGCNFRSAAPTSDLPRRGIRCPTRWFALFFFYLAWFGTKPADSLQFEPIPMETRAKTDDTVRFWLKQTNTAQFWPIQLPK